MDKTQTTTTRRPRVLFLCQTLPYPPDAGVNIRAFHILRLLSESFDVTALCFYRRATRSTPEQVRQGVRGLSVFAEVEAFPIPQECSRVRYHWDHLRSVLKRRAYTVYVHDSADFRARLDELLRTNVFDLIHLDSLDLSGYLDGLPPVPVVVDHHNIESSLLRRRASQEPSILRRGYIAYQATLTAKEERQWCDRVHLNLTVSNADRELLREFVPRAAIAVVPNGVDTGYFNDSHHGSDGIVFVGGHTWFPNRDGMNHFAREILPIVQDARPEVPVYWIGRAAQKDTAYYRDTFGIVMEGYVEDIRPRVGSAACFIVPLRVGGGTRLKILDAWAMGKAVVSTSQGCEGLQVHDDRNILIRDQPEDFARAVLRVLQDDDLRRRLGQEGRKTAETEYDWSVIGRKMIDEYRQLLSPASSEGAVAERASSSSQSIGRGQRNDPGQRYASVRSWSQRSKGRR